MSHQPSRARASMTLAAVLVAPLSLRSALVSAQTAPAPTPTPKATTSPQKDQTVRRPMTAAEHLAKAEEYKKKAAMYRAEVATHRKMLEDYARDRLFIVEGMVEDPDVVKMSQHCEAYIKPAEALAIEAEKFADYHRMRAAELEGK